jgi:hypothetical protein
MRLCGGCAGSAQRARDRGPFGTKFSDLCAFIGNNKAKEVAERSPQVLRGADVLGGFGELLKSWAGTRREQGRGVVDRSPQVLRSADVLSRFGELTEIMGGDEEGAREVVGQSPSVLGGGGVLCAGQVPTTPSTTPSTTPTPAKKVPSPNFVRLGVG